MAAKLPPEFSDLEPFSDMVPGHRARALRQAVGQPHGQMQAFYDAITPRAEAAMTYCDKFPLDDMPDDALNLLHLLYSMVMVSFPVECWGQPRVPDSGAAALDCVSEPVP